MFDGTGGEYPATVAEVGKRQVTVTTAEHDSREAESPLHTVLGIGVSRGERMEWVVQKATELGVNVIAPLLSERTEVKLSGERAGKKRLHWQQIAISACEQSGRNRVPQILPLQSMAQWTQQVDADARLVLHHRAEGAALASDAPASAALLVGPEGGLSESEVTTAFDAGFNPLVLGPRVLRTETAPLAALSLLQIAWGDIDPLS